MTSEIERQIQQITDRLGGDIVEVELQPASVTAVAEGVSPEWNFFENAIRWLPAASLIAAQRVRDYGEVVTEVISFVKVYQGELRRNCLWPEVRDLLSGILSAWTERIESFEVPTYFPQGDPYLHSLSSSAVDIDELLNGLYESQIQDNGTTLFYKTFTHLCSETNNVARMLHILGLFYRVRCQPSSLPLYRADLVLAKAFDQSDCDRLWRNSRELAKHVLPRNTYTALESLFSLKR